MSTTFAAPQRRPIRAVSRAGLLALAVCFLVCFAVAWSGGAITRPALADWYAGLVKPAFTPPNWAFPVAWTILFGCMTVAVWLVWLRRTFQDAPVAYALFGAQLTLNLFWSVLFFGLRWPPAALAEVAVLVLAVLATLASFWRIDRRAGLLFVPYLAWVGFAAILNAAIVGLN